jgi:hypothetical protein
MRTTARTAAQRLSGEYGYELRQAVENAMQDGQARPGQYIDPVSLASLIVSASALAWTVYTDLRARNEKPISRTVVTRRVREELVLGEDTARRERVIEVVVEKVFAEED